MYYLIKIMYYVIKTGTSKNLEMTRNGDLEFSNLSLILAPQLFIELLLIN